MLLRLAVGHCPLQLEIALLKQMAGIEPDLKMRLRFPNSAMVFEGNWRALKKVVPQPPLFLECLHRNLNALGYWCAESVENTGSGDPIGQAQFAVLGRLVRRRLGDLTNTDDLTQMIAGSSLLFVETIRQASRTAEDLRDNELAMPMDSDIGYESESRGGNLRNAVSVSVLLVVFLLSVHWGRSASMPASLLFTAVAAAAFVRLFWVVIRIG
jgi:hypothetical protein